MSGTRSINRPKPTSFYYEGVEAWTLKWDLDFELIF